MRIRGRIRGIERWRADRGSTMVEFSLISLMFIIVLLGIIEMGRMVLVYTTVANAARAGARYAIVHGKDQSGTAETTSGPSGPTCPCAGVNTVVQNFASAGLLTTSNLTITVTYPGGNNKPGSLVKVAVSYPYDPLVTYFNSLLNTTFGSTSEGVIAF